MYDFCKQKVIFLNWILFMVVLTVGAAYGAKTGILVKMLNTDQNHITWGIAAVTLLTALHIGFLSWRLDETNVDDILWRSVWMLAAPGLFLLTGIVGTGSGFYLQSEAIVAGSATVALLGTGILPTVFAAGCAVIIGILSVNLLYGIAKINHLKGLDHVPHGAL
jgi:hypothetical protein